MPTCPDRLTIIQRACYVTRGHFVTVCRYSISTCGSTGWRLWLPKREMTTVLNRSPLNVLGECQGFVKLGGFLPVTVLPPRLIKLRGVWISWGDFTTERKAPSLIPSRQAATRTGPPFKPLHSRRDDVRVFPPNRLPTRTTDAHPSS